MNKDLPLQITPNIGPDISDTLEVFLYTNLNTMISPNPFVLLTPSFHAALLATLNDVGIRHNIDLQKDLKDILDVFVIVNSSIIATDTVNFAVLTPV